MTYNICIAKIEPPFLSFFSDHFFFVYFGYFLLIWSKFCFVEFDCLTGSKISSIDIGARVVRMLYSPTNVDSIIAILDVSLLHYLISIWTFFFMIQINFLHGPVGPQNNGVYPVK